MPTGIVLAGRRNRGALRAVAPEPEWEALIPVAGRPMAAHVVEALRGAPEVARVVVAGPGELAGPGVEVVAPGDDVTATLRSAVAVLGSGSEGDEIVLAAGDAPLLTASAVTGLVAHCRTRGLAFGYPIVSRSLCEAEFPGVRRTYVRLREGSFTGGNCFYLRREAVGATLGLLTRVHAERKHPLRLARLLGWDTVLGVLLGFARLPRLEALGSRLLGHPAGAWICPEAGVGVDVDRPADLADCRRRLEGLPASAATRDAGGREGPDAR